MKKLLLITLFVGSFTASFGQLFSQNLDLVFKRSDSTVYELALTGGVNQAQFSQIDLNNDGKLDLFLFDRSGNKVSCFIAAEDNGELSYFYDPSFEEVFPKGLSEFMILKDYNEDNLPDLWTYNQNENKVQLFKNIGTTEPVFELKKNLRAYNFNNPPLDSSDFVHFKGNFPAVVDLDQDGDMDFVTNAAFCGSNITFYLNNTVERGLNLEDIEFEIADYCLGNLGENGIELELDAFCFFQRNYRYKKHCGFKSLLFYDSDQDDDLDLLFGTSEQPTNPLFFIENGKSDLSMEIDTFITFDTAYFDPLVEPLISVGASGSLVDVDLDGVLDLILTTNEVLTVDEAVEETNNVLYFRNLNQNDQPNFSFVQNDFLSGEMIDHGGHTAPVFGDLDGDNDQDILILTSGDDANGNRERPFLVYYKNIGDSMNPEFILEEINFSDLASDSLTGEVIPALSDLDNDGDLDMLVGRQDGSLTLYRNTGSSILPQFSKESDNYKGIDVGERAAPCFYDLDGDGLEDLLIGEYDGNINYFKNKGNLSNPDFQLEDDSLGGILNNELIPQSVFDPDRGFYDTMIYQYFGSSSPTVAELNNGRTAIVAGGAEGKLRVFEIASDLSQHFTDNPDQMHQTIGDSLYVKDWGALVNPTAVDLEGDGSSDILFGNSRGGLNYVVGRDNSSVEYKARRNQLHTGIYPNPSSGVLNIELGDKKDILSYEIRDLAGRTLQSSSRLNGKKIRISEGISNGVYIIVFQLGDQQYLPQKFLLHR